MSEDVFSFAFIADPQIGSNSPAGLRGPGSDKERLDRAISYINESEIDFAVLGGDQTGSADEEGTDAQLDALEESLSALAIPCYGVVGNHDQGHPAQRWKYIERGLPVRFSITHKNSFLVGINSSWIRGEYGETYLQEEWEYLEAELSGAPAACEHRFVVMHWPLFNCHPGEEETFSNMPNREKLIDLFGQHGVSCVLSGHFHQDVDACWRGISLISGVGTSMHLPCPQELSFKIVTVFQDGWSARRVSVGKG